MRNILAVLLCTMGLTLSAQYTNGAAEEFSYDFTYGFLIPSQTVDNLQQEWYSNCHSFAFLGEVPFSHSTGFGYGLGFSIYNLHNNLHYVDNDPAIGGNPDVLPADSSYNANKQNISFIDLPLELRYRGKTNKKGKFFRVVVGAKVGYRLSGSAYHRDDDFAIRRYRIFTTTPWRVQAYTRIGYGKIALFAGYELLPTLNGQPKLLPSNLNYHMVNIGVSLLL